MKLGKKIINKRGIIIVSILAGTLFVLTGCGKAEISVKTYDKENEVETSKIAEVENTTEENTISNVTTEENKVEENKTKENTNKNSEDARKEAIKKTLKNTDWKNMGRTNSEYVTVYFRSLKDKGEIYFVDSIDESAHAHRIYAITYENGKINISKTPLTTEYASAGIDDQSGVFVVTSDVTGEIKLYRLEGTEFVEFAYSKINPEDGSEYWYVNEQNVSYGKFYSYFEEDFVEGVNIELTEDNIDGYVRMH